MNKIYKYPLKMADSQDLDLPYGAEILTVQNQLIPYGDGREQLNLWAIIDPDQNARQARTIRIVGTGHDFIDADQCHYIGTVQQSHGQLIWHIFEIIIPNF